MKKNKLYIITLISLGFVSMLAHGSTITLEMRTGGGIYELYASSSSGDNFGIAAYKIVLTNILTAVQKSPRALELGTNVVRGFTVGRFNLNGPGPLFAAQNTTDLPTLIFGIGQTPGNFNMIPIDSDVGVSWASPVLLASGTYNVEGPDPAFNEVQTRMIVFQSNTGTGNPIIVDQISFTSGVALATSSN